MHRTIALLAAAAALMAPLAVVAQVPDFPQRKPGLWEMTTAAEGAKGVPAVTVKMCLDPATDRDLMDYGLQLTGGTCKSITSRREGKSFIVEADCRIGGKSQRSRTVLTGDLQSAYTARVESTTDRGEGKPPKVMATTIAFTWKSTDCPGMKPGDIGMGKGVKLNIKQIKAFSGLIR